MSATTEHSYSVALRDRSVSPAVLRLGTRVSIPVRRRSVVVVCVLLVVLVVLCVLTLTLGSLGVPLGQLVPAMTGRADGTDSFILGVLRGPRLTTGIAAGAAFGVSGALFQTVTRNPLGSPDVIGLSAGAGAGAAAFGLLWPGTIPVPVGALLGALVAMALIYLGTGRGFSSPGRVILVGIGVSAISLAFIQFVISRSVREQATVIAAYLNGSLDSRSWSDALIGWVCLAVLLPASLTLTRRLQVIELGDQAADALGARSSQTRVLAILLAIALSTAAVTIAGPVAFVALTAPQIARRLTRATGAGLTAAAVTGACIMVLADLCVQQLPFPVQLPVGILTAAVGGVYLGYLLVTEWRKGTV